jgi:hypothetical protein
MPVGTRIDGVRFAPPVASEARGQTSAFRSLRVLDSEAILRNDVMVASFLDAKED